MSNPFGSDAFHTPQRHSTRSHQVSSSVPHTAPVSHRRVAQRRNHNDTTLRIGHYRLGKTLGVGSFGKVKLAEHEITGHKVAVKIVNRKRIRDLRMDRKVRREIQILKLFRHPHIIKLYEVIETPTDIFMIMEYVSGGELFDYIVQRGKLGETAARKFVQQIVGGVEYCHRHQVVHRDLKPENLLLDTATSSVKIADFGLSNMMKDGEFLSTSCGSPNYAAPEVISGKLYAGPEVDVWSCGVILYALLCARLPFDDDYIPNLFKKIRGGIYTIPGHVSPECADLIKKCLVVDPLQRITVAEIKEHPWFAIDLPPYLAATIGATPLVPSLDEIDPECLNELAEKFGVSREYALEQLQIGSDATGDDEDEPNSSMQQLRSQRTEYLNEFIVAYDLIHDNRHNVYGDSIPVNKLTSSLNSLILSASPPISLRDARPFHADLEVEKGLYPSPQASVTGSMDTGSDDVSSENQRHDPHRWSLGVISRRAPGETMECVMGALAESGFKWKHVNSYHLRCRYEQHDQVMKTSLHLYKVKNNRYLIDLKVLSGPQLLFFDACARLLSLIKASVGARDSVLEHNKRHFFAPNEEPPTKRRNARKTDRKLF